MNAETERTQHILSSCIHDKLLIQKMGKAMEEVTNSYKIAV